jgi:hypothetical protein
VQIAHFTGVGIRASCQTRYPTQFSSSASSNQLRRRVFRRYYSKMPLSLQEFLKSAACDLPCPRDPKLPLAKQLARMHSAFLKGLKGVDPNDPCRRSSIAQQKLIKQSSFHISKAVAEYLNGSPFKAATEMRAGLRLLRPHLEQLIARRQDLSNLFRVREVDTLANAQRKDIFHVPFELRHRVTTQRYSISGWPSLYLGASLMVCWEEVGRPAFHKLAVANFDAEKSLNVLDFGYRPTVIADLHSPKDENEISFFTPQFMTSYLICWPLLAACSIEAEHRGSPFIEEYIVPQLLLQWLRDEEFKIDGIRYFSMRVHQTWQAPRLAINYVFPVRTDAATGHCNELKKRFTFTLPVPWNILEGVNLETAAVPRANEPYLLNSEVGVVYDDTVFGKLEPLFGPLPKQPLA